MRRLCPTEASGRQAQGGARCPVPGAWTPCPRPPPGCSQGFQRKEEGEGGGTAGLRQEASRSLHRPPSLHPTGQSLVRVSLLPPAASPRAGGGGTGQEHPGTVSPACPAGRLCLPLPASVSPSVKERVLTLTCWVSGRQIGHACPRAWTLSIDCRVLPGDQQRDEHSEARRPQGGEEVVPTVLCAEDLAVWGTACTPRPLARVSPASRALP